MIRTLTYLLLALFLSLHLSGCSLFGSDDEEQDSATVSEEKKEGDEYAYDDFEEGGEEAEESDDDFDDEEGEEVLEVGVEESEGDPTDIATEDSFGEEDAVDDYPDDDYSLDGGDSGGSDEIAALEPSPEEDDFADADEVALDEGSGDQSIPEEPLDSNEEEDLFARDEEPEAAPQQSFANNNGDTGFGGSNDYSGSGFDDVPAFVPVKKMKPAAYKRAGANINRLYIARSGDNMGSIAKKIYGSNRASDLLKWNSHFQGKNLKVGDKIYYSSPNSPADQSMKTFYEDNNISPQYFTAQKNSNLRKVAKKLLGHDRSWMEIWATNNNMEDKWSLSSGEQVKYWPGGTAITVAKAAPRPVEPVPAEEPEPEELPPEETEDVAEVEEVEEISEIEEVADIEDPTEMDSDEDFAPPPPPAAGSISPPPPPNPVAPPPPPPSPLANKLNKVKKAAGASMGAQDDSMVMGALGGLLILAAVILLIFLRRGRSKRVNFSQTQV